MRIRQLSVEVANQIAAGEVIERPASVVKELLENSLDAGASQIEIDIEFGGLTVMRISDNGMGILPEDLPLSIAPHATSKINILSDLYTIKTMGFRGEALASIASVSRLSILSKSSSQDHGMILHKSGHDVSITPHARTQGTTVEVRDLFFNAPVRKKFLKSAQSEFLAIEAIIRRFALSASHIAIQVRHNDKISLSLPAATCAEEQSMRIQRLMGKNFIDSAIKIDVEHGNMSLSGWISHPDYQRSQNDKLWVYINQRMVKDKLILHAIKQTYVGLIHPGRFPACVLYFTLPPNELDINVHPTKHEVRYQQPRLIHDFFASHISQALTFTQSETVAVKMERPTKVLHVNEAYAPKLGFPKPAEKSSWTVINNEIVLLFVEEIPYLVNVLNLKRKILLTELYCANKPFSSRPILIPMTYTLENAGQFIERYRHVLLDLGLEIDWLGDKSILVRTLPLAVPYLEVGDLFDKLSRIKGSVDKENILTVLVESQTFNTFQFSLEEQEEFIAAFKYYLSNNKQPSWYLRLDLERCRDLIYG